MNSRHADKKLLECTTKKLLDLGEKHQEELRVAAKTFTQASTISKYVTKHRILCKYVDKSGCANISAAYDNEHTTVQHIINSIEDNAELDLLQANLIVIPHEMRPQTIDAIEWMIIEQALSRRVDRDRRTAEENWSFPSQGNGQGSWKKGIAKE